MGKIVCRAQKLKGGFFVLFSRIHILTPLVFMFGLCCTRICPYCAYCGYWNFLKKAMDNWTRQTRMIICSVVAFPLAISMISVGAVSIERCSLQQQDASSNGSSSDLNTSLPSTILESNQTLIQHTKGIKNINTILYYFIAYDSTFWGDIFKQKTTSCQQKTSFEF